MAKRIWLGRFGGQVFCCAGQPRTCHNFRLIEAAESEFHTADLVRATDAINAILDIVRSKAPEGRYLAAFDTNEGLLLVYAESLEAPPEDIERFVTADSPQDQIRDVLDLQAEIGA